jgi:hypothetical protein
MKRKIKYLSILLFLFVFASTFIGCSGGEMYDDSLNTTVKSESAIVGEDTITSDTLLNTENVSSNEIVVSNRKIIEEYDLSVETKEFDKLLNNITSEINNLGGYIEKSSIDNNNNYRNATFTIRVTQNNGSKFNDFMSKNSNVVYSETNTKDVTLTYVDIESRITSYKTEQTKLEELMKNATTLDDILKIQDRLTTVIYQIETYESQLRTYDNLIDYTTINLSVREVEKETITTELSVWEKIHQNLQDGFENVGNFIVNFFIFSISSIPYLSLIGIPVVIIVVIKSMVKRHSKKVGSKRLSPHKEK